MNFKDVVEIVQENLRKRDEAVVSAVRDGDLEPLKRYAVKGGVDFDNDYVIEIAAHKMCCEITTMPDELQEKSRKWLRESGYTEGIG